MVKTYGDLYQDTRRALARQAPPQDPGVLARLLVCQASGKTQAQFLADRDLYAGEKIVAEVEENLRRLLADEPIAYVLGQWEFYGLPMLVSPKVLIPRDDTCALTELAIRQGLFLDQDPRILDLCCGSGCIGLAIASRVKDARVTLADVSLDALSVAKENTALNKLTGRVRCVQADARKPVSAFLGKFDLIVSNPPYISARDMEGLPPSVRDYEPHLALYGGEDGLDFYRDIAANFRTALKPGGFLCFEFGDGQGDDVCGILEENGYTILERARDYNDRERSVLARYGRKED